MSDHKITGDNVDNLASQILINIGLINAAALAAAVAEVDKFHTMPFAIGLIAALVSQLSWFMLYAIDYALDGKDAFTDELSNGLGWLLMSVVILGTALISAGSIVYGCLSIMEISHANSLLVSCLFGGICFITFFYVLIRKATADYLETQKNNAS